MTERDYNLSELQWIVGGFSRSNEPARQMRNEVMSDWLGELANKLYNRESSVEDAKAQTNATVGHTVESFVEELKQRVGLENISKHAEQILEIRRSAGGIPLSKRGEEVKDPKRLLKEMSEYITTYCLRPSHGQTGPEACFNALKEKFGPDTVQELGRDAVMEMITSISKLLKEPNLADGLPKYDGSPTPLREQDDEKSNQLQLGTSVQK